MAADTPQTAGSSTWQPAAFAICIVNCPLARNKPVSLLPAAFAAHFVPLPDLFLLPQIAEYSFVFLLGGGSAGLRPVRTAHGSVVATLGDRVPDAVCRMAVSPAAAGARQIRHWYGFHPDAGRRGALLLAAIRFSGDVGSVHISDLPRQHAGYRHH